MVKQGFKGFICILCAVLIAASFGGCSIGAYSVEELKTYYSAAFENSFDAELYYWKETINAADYTAWRTCNVYTEIDKKYEPVMDENGQFANMKIDVYDEYNKKGVYKALCGKSQSSAGAEDKNYLFENGYDESGNASDYRKVKMTPQEYVRSDDFVKNYALSAKLSELAGMTVDDMIFDIDSSLMEHKGKVVKFSFAVRPEYIEKYKAQTGNDSIFAGSKYATMEFAYDRFASIVIYSEEQLGGNISADKEVYKLEAVYFGPIVNIPSYDSEPWVNC